MASLRRNQELSHVRMSQFQLAPKWVHHWPKLNQSAGCACAIACLGKDTKCQRAAVRERSEKMWNNPADTKVSEEGSAPGTREEILLQHMEMEIIPLQLLEKHAGADSHCAAHGSSYTRTGGYKLKEAAAHGEFCKFVTGTVYPWRVAWTGAGCLAGVLSHGAPTLEQFLKNYTL